MSTLRRMGTQWEYSSNLTGVYFDVLHEIATSGTTFKDKNALITGVEKGSIGVEILKGLMSGGMLSSPPLATTVPQLNTTREFSSVSAAMVPLLLSFPSTKARNRMWRRLLTTIT